MGENKYINGLPLGICLPLSSGIISPWFHLLATEVQTLFIQIRGLGSLGYLVGFGRDLFKFRKGCVLYGCFRK